MFKKLAALMAVVMLLSVALAPAMAEKNEKVKIVATTFPSYDWLRQILGEREQEVELTLLQDSGIDLHNFQPTAQDFVKVSSADLFVYIGGVSDGWVDDAIGEAHNKHVLAVNLMDAMGDAVKQDVTVEGMQESAHAHNHDDHEHEAEAAHDHEHEHEHEAEAAHDHEHEAEAVHDHEHEAEADHDHEHDHEHEHEGREHNHADEHIWLSLRNAKVLVAALKDALVQVDAGHAAVYEANAAAYIAKLEALDKEYAQAVAQVAEPVLLFGDRFPFRYLMDDYGITYYAAFAGCSAETEASFKTVAFLAGKTDEHKLKAVLTLDGSDQAIAKAVINATGPRDQQLLTLNAMQSIGAQDIANGITYLDIMQDNLAVLRQAL